MKCLLLAAGYATRLYPLTKDFPKPLLPVGGKPILDWLISDLRKGQRIDQFVVISNHRFAPIFEKWAAKQDDVVVIDDQTSSNETRLGAVKDILFALSSLHTNDDCLVLAGDNVLDFSLNGFVDFALSKGTSCVMAYYEEDLAKISKSGGLVLDNEHKVLAMEEKPSHPSSHYCCPPFYFYKKEDLSRLEEALSNGCGYDAPGSFVSWLCKKTNVYAYLMPGHRHDIGNLESYAAIKDAYKGV